MAPFVQILIESALLICSAAATVAVLSIGTWLTVNSSLWKYTATKPWLLLLSAQAVLLVVHYFVLLLSLRSMMAVGVLLLVSISLSLWTLKALKAKIEGDSKSTISEIDRLLAKLSEGPEIRDQELDTRVLQARMNAVTAKELLTNPPRQASTKATLFECASSGIVFSLLHGLFLYMYKMPIAVSDLVFRAVFIMLFAFGYAKFGAKRTGT